MSESRAQRCTCRVAGQRRTYVWTPNQLDSGTLPCHRDWAGSGRRYWRGVSPIIRQEDSDQLERINVFILFLFVLHSSVPWMTFRFRESVSSVMVVVWLVSPDRARLDVLHD